jgi:hypothetical protein
MAEDPIIEEIHRVREQLLEEHGGFDGYLEHLKVLQEELKGRIVTREPRQPLATDRKIS